MLAPKSGSAMHCNLQCHWQPMSSLSNSARALSSSGLARSNPTNISILAHVWLCCRISALGFRLLAVGWRLVRLQPAQHPSNNYRGHNSTQPDTNTRANACATSVQFRLSAISDSQPQPRSQSQSQFQSCKLVSALRDIETLSLSLALARSVNNL